VKSVLTRGVVAAMAPEATSARAAAKMNLPRCIVNPFPPDLQEYRQQLDPRSSLLFDGFRWQAAHRSDGLQVYDDANRALGSSNDERMIGVSASGCARTLFFRTAALLPTSLVHRQQPLTPTNQPPVV